MKYIILSSLLMSACAHTLAPDPKKCCERVSLHNQEMEKFTRYCKVALFLHRGDTINDKKVKPENIFYTKIISLFRLKPVL